MFLGKTVMSRSVVPALLLLAALAFAGSAFAHAIGGADAAFVAAADGVDFAPFAYLGAKHMVTGYDHLLFLAGVIFYLRSLRHIILFASLFSLGHSVTLLTGVLLNISVSSYLVDAVIGLSVSYKALDNLGGLSAVGIRIDNRLAVGGFGLVHGFGLATKLQDLGLQGDGLTLNLIAFNIGVEIGQLLALSAIVLFMTIWRSGPFFTRLAIPANLCLFSAGLVLFGYQMVGYFVEGNA
jgi:hypothetical protein